MQQQIPSFATVFFSVQTHFHMCEGGNKQNLLFWVETNPQRLHERPLQTLKLLSGVQSRS